MDAMNRLANVAWLLSHRRSVLARDRWPREILEAHRQRSLLALQKHAVERSPWFAARCRHLVGRPLSEWPVTSKPELMAAFNDWVTDRSLTLESLEAWMREPSADKVRVYEGRYVVTATSGSTGRRGVFLADCDEWRAILSSYVRANDWAGVTAGLSHRLKMAVVSSTNPWHQSAAVGASLSSPVVKTLRLDALRPLPELVASLNAFQPESLVAYASMGRELAEEQLAGRLLLNLEAMLVASEVLSPTSRERIRSAFGVDPYDTYAATETATIAAECEHHRHHLFEDFLITEIVDERNEPVPLGSFGSKVLVTVLFSRTQPLIRYEMSDCVRLLEGSCPCGRSYRLFGGVQGRTEDTLHLRGPNGLATLRPNLFHDVLDTLPASGWQVVQEPARLHVLVERPGPDVKVDEVRRQLTASVARAAGFTVAVDVTATDALPRSALGKAPLIRALKP